MVAPTFSSTTCAASSWTDKFDSSGNWVDWDGTPDDVAKEITKQDAVINSLAPVLQGDINPADLGISVPSPLLACWRKAPSGKYFIVVNPVATVKSNVTLTVLRENPMPRPKPADEQW
jgi:hypothetical protein